LTQVLFIAAGGAVGAVGRFWVSQSVHAWLGRDFPYGTLCVNVLGSLLMGVLYVLLIERMSVGPEWRGFLTIGLLGAFTTFSAFSMETVNLLSAGEPWKALLNVISNVLLCVVASGFGVMLARQV